MSHGERDPDDEYDRWRYDVAEGLDVTPRPMRLGYVHPVAQPESVVEPVEVPPRPRVSLADDPRMKMFRARQLAHLFRVTRRS